MSRLFKLQSYSFVSRLGAQVIGILQGMVVIRLLSVADWATVELIKNFTAIIGTTSSVGLTSGSTREISGAKTNDEAQSVFVVSLIIRVLLSLPFAIFVFFYSDSFSQTLQNPSIVSFAVKIVALALFVDSVSGIFNSVLSGFQRFKTLFTYQVFRALLSFILFVSLIYFFQFLGYFFALFIFNALNAIILLVLAIKNFDNPFKKVSYKEFIYVLKQIFGISMVIFLVKLIYSLWENLPNLYLNKFLSVPIEQIALFALALTFSKKIMIFSDSITDVTLPLMSKAYLNKDKNFKQVYKKNFRVTFAIITFAVALVTFWSKEIVLIYSGKEQFLNSAYLVPFVMLGMWSYSKINLIKSSIFVPANKLVILFITYISLLINTYVFFAIMSKLFVLDTILLFAISFGLGSLFSFILSYLFVLVSFKVNLLGVISVLYLLVSTLYISTFYFLNNFGAKLLLTLLYFAITLVFFNYMGINKILLSKFNLKTKQ